MHSALIRPVVAGTRRAALASRSYASQRPPTYEERPSYDTTDPEPNYPQLPYVSRQHLPPKQWDDMLLRRNYGDTLHEQEEVLSMWGPDIPPAGLTGESALRQLLGALAGFAVLGVYIKYFGIPDRPAVPREFPYDGLVKELGGVEAIKANPERVE
ncbi:hypothetical protein Agabi119p4_5419 [Agaricus bisporus var. burnettii]|uniref:Uncharacterized protein n=1 Tax=Agaricus bisporus var. burnettii TaxID=192524 RepID=A0A8H7F1N5_AGABI|nr:hypothetical protein Agabi119p4_5419 [Agaricus bisporus var. burnettii]